MRMISVGDLTFTYARASKPAISSLSFTVDRDDIFEFIDPRGAAKPTIQKMM